jgi:putative two-component system response regulator
MHPGLRSLDPESVHLVIPTNETVVAISNLSEYRDEETGLHIERTRSYCRLMAMELKKLDRYAASITDAYIENIYHAAPLHDIGKIGIPDRILLKPDKLTADEFEIMKTHVSIGVSTLKKVQQMYPKNAFINMGIALTRAHHEKWNGTGYPENLSCEDIPLSGRIMAIADVYDALRSTRPYKSAMPHEKAVEIIIDGAGSHFDPELVKVFIEIEKGFQEIAGEMKDM